MIEGKIANQSPGQRMGRNQLCDACRTMMPAPTKSEVVGPLNEVFNLYHYLVNPEFKNKMFECFIYESKSGVAVTYCSDRCRKKHNHRFHKKLHDTKK